MIDSLTNLSDFEQGASYANLLRNPIPNKRSRPQESCMKLDRKFIVPYKRVHHSENALSMQMVSLTAASQTTDVNEKTDIGQSQRSLANAT